MVELERGQCGAVACVREFCVGIFVVSERWERRVNGECVAARAEAAIVYSSSDGGERLIQAITFKTLFEIFCPRHRAGKGSTSRWSRARNEIAS